ncbi:unnamed protein product [Chondrus crispus]|uniref:Uncharacterized protein n=1 Tax=Chondrus crispus TaxID=2769 RepID=R7QDR7_CHOCR|nr:unnamed protein product [Chondrus crispus]CDF36657.1 unnamed protein product [Chondrus crispus]|eukprot:XP_005716476.1 unnamed protein product [Chondrus crispus]
MTRIKKRRLKKFKKTVPDYFSANCTFEIRKGCHCHNTDPQQSITATFKTRKEWSCSGTRLV